MKNHMAELRAKKGITKKPISTHKQVSKEHIQSIVNEALEKYYLASSPIVEVPEKLVTIKNGKAKLIETLTKAGNLKKIDGENVIKLEAGDNLNVKSNGTKYNADEILKTIPSQTIVHKVEPKKTRPQIKATTKDYNDIIDVKNENMSISKILHNPQSKV
jgi:protoporphyrinogen oxidase